MDDTHTLAYVGNRWVQESEKWSLGLPGEDAVSQNVVIVTHHVCRRKRRSRVPGMKDEVTYEVWLIPVLCPQDEAAAALQPSVGPVLSADRLGERLRESMAEVAAGRVEGMIWKTADDLSEDQVADLVAGLPERMKALAEQPLDILGDAVGVPAPAVSLGADVTATLVLKPILKPVESVIHAAEVVAIAVGLMTGLHPLVITCVKHLAHDELGSVLAHTFEQIKLMSPADALALDGQLSTLRPFGVNPSSAAKAPAAVVDRGPVTGSETTEHSAFGPAGQAARRMMASPIVNPQSSKDATNSDHEPAVPHRPLLPTATAVNNQAAASTLDYEGKGSLSQESAALFQEAQALRSQDATSATDNTVNKDLRSATSRVNGVTDLGAAF